jgi:hypothetical protein
MSGPMAYLGWNFFNNTPTDQATFLGFELFVNSYSVPGVWNHRVFIQFPPVSSDDVYNYEDYSLILNSWPSYYVRAAYLVDGDTVYSAISLFSFPAVLPITLVSFNTEVSGTTVKLNWTTATEVNNMGFYIERLSSEEEWLTVGFIDGHYNNNGIIDYTFVDNDPLPGVNYYRLKQTDFDGRFEYFGPLAQLYNPAEEFALKVSRLYDQVNILLPGNEPGLLEVFDLTGKLRYSKTAMGPISLQELKGVHIVRFRMGLNVINEKIFF